MCCVRRSPRSMIYWAPPRGISIHRHVRPHQLHANHPGACLSQSAASCEGEYAGHNHLGNSHHHLHPLRRNAAAQHHSDRSRHRRQACHDYRTRQIDHERSHACARARKTLRIALNGRDRDRSRRRTAGARLHRMGARATSRVRATLDALPAPLNGRGRLSRVGYLVGIRRLVQARSLSGARLCPTDRRSTRSPIGQLVCTAHVAPCVLASLAQRPPDRWDLLKLRVHPRFFRRSEWDDARPKQQLRVGVVRRRHSTEEEGR
jgi:hypothetical protein